MSCPARTKSVHRNVRGEKRLRSIELAARQSQHKSSHGTQSVAQFVSACDALEHRHVTFATGASCLRERVVLKTGGFRDDRAADYTVKGTRPEVTCKVYLDG